MSQSLVDAVVGIGEIDGFKCSHERDHQGAHQHKGHPLEFQAENLAGAKQEEPGYATTQDETTATGDVLQETSSRMKRIEVRLVRGPGNEVIGIYPLDACTKAHLQLRSNPTSLVQLHYLRIIELAQCSSSARSPSGI